MKCLALRRVVVRLVVVRQAKAARHRQVQAAKRFNKRNEWVR